MQSKKIYLLLFVMLSGCQSMSQTSLEDRYSTDINPYLTHTKTASLDPLSPVAQAVQRMRIREDSSTEYVTFKPKTPIISPTAKIASYHMKINKAPVAKVQAESILPLQQAEVHSSLHKPALSGLHIPGE